MSSLSLRLLDQHSLCPCLVVRFCISLLAACLARPGHMIRIAVFEVIKSLDIGL